MYMCPMCHTPSWGLIHSTHTLWPNPASAVRLSCTEAGNQVKRKQKWAHMYTWMKHDYYYRTDACSNIFNITPVNRIIYQNMSSLDYALVGTRRNNETRRQTLRTNSGVTRVVVGEHFCMWSICEWFWWHNVHMYNNNCYTYVYKTIILCNEIAGIDEWNYILHVLLMIYSYSTYTNTLHFTGHVHTAIIAI